jgi:hypothetical protein
VAGVSGIFAFRALADHPQHPVAAIFAQVGHVGGASLIEAQRVVQQQPHQRRSAQRPGTGVGVGRRNQGPGLVAVQAHRGGVVRVHHQPGHAVGGHPADQVMRRAVPTKRQRLQTAPHAGRRRPVVELGSRPTGPRAPRGRQRPGPPTVEPADPGHHIGGVGAPGARRPQPGQPRRDQDLLPLPQPADRRQLRPHPAQHLVRYRRRARAERRRGDGAAGRSRSPAMARMVVPGTDIGWYSGLSPVFRREFSLTEGAARGTRGRPGPRGRDQRGLVAGTQCSGLGLRPGIRVRTTGPEAG